MVFFSIASSRLGPHLEATTPKRALDLLSRECLTCHNEDKRKGGLSLHSQTSLRDGGDYGPVIKKENPLNSPLLEVLAPGADPHMPPKSQLSSEEIRLLRQWVEKGAAWDRPVLKEPNYDWQDIRESPAQFSQIKALTFDLSPDEELLAVGNEGVIKILRYGKPNPEVVYQIQTKTALIRSLAWTSDGRFLVFGSKGLVQIWDRHQPWKAPRQVRNFEGSLTAATRISRQPTMVALGESVPGSSGTIHVIDVTSLDILFSWPAHTDTIQDLDSDPSGLLLASASDDGYGKIFELALGLELGTLEGHRFQVSSIRFGPGNRIATGGVDGELKVWDLARSEPLFNIGKPSSGIAAITWNLADNSLVAARENGDISQFSNLAEHSGAQSSRTAEEKKLDKLTGHPTKLVSTQDKAILRLLDNGSLVETVIKENKSTELVAPSPTIPNAEAPSFVKDILPVLSKAGCSTGGCHSKPKGQNGFKLSIFAYDPVSDYREIVHDGRSRRINEHAPESSLFLLKPTLGLAHEGGQRIEKDSDFYRLLKAWITGGLVFKHENESDLLSIALTPPTGSYTSNEAIPLTVTATYSDGEVRDVTHLSDFKSSDKAALEIINENQARFVTKGVEAVVIARYMGTIAKARYTSPSNSSIAPEAYQALASNNFIDELAHERFQELGILPSGLANDQVFFRRAALDAIGMLPTEQQRARFLKPGQKLDREAWIRELLNSPNYANYWANHWADVFRPNPDRAGVKSIFMFDQWLRSVFRENLPYDQFVRRILLHQGTNHEMGPAAIYRDRRTPEERTTMFGQAFLGVRFECARCHHHPFESWSQEDFYQSAAYFAAMKQRGAGLSPPISAGKEWFYEGNSGSVKHPVTGLLMKPKPPGDPAVENPHSSLRETYVSWLINRDNPFFSRAIVNRVWSVFFGRGFVEPIDDFRTSNPPVHEPLLDALASWFHHNDYDLKALATLIMESNLYQRSSIPNESNLTDSKHFSHYYRKRLRAEVLLDAINDVTGASDTFAGLPPGARAMETWSFKTSSHFMDAFSRPNASTDPPCERDQSSSVVQALHLMNAETIEHKIRAKDGFISRLLAQHETYVPVVRSIYDRAFAREPNLNELATALAYFEPGGIDRQDAVQDLLWAVLNSAEFVYNH